MLRAVRPCPGDLASRLIDTEVAGADMWRTGTHASQSDAELRDEIGDRVLGLVRDLAGDSEAG